MVCAKWLLRSCGEAERLATRLAVPSAWHSIGPRERWDRPQELRSGTPPRSQALGEGHVQVFPRAKGTWLETWGSFQHPNTPCMARPDALTPETNYVGKYGSAMERLGNVPCFPHTIHRVRLSPPGFPQPLPRWAAFLPRHPPRKGAKPSWLLLIHQYGDIECSNIRKYRLTVITSLPIQIRRSRRPSDRLMCLGLLRSRIKLIKAVVLPISAVEGSAHQEWPLSNSKFGHSLLLLDFDWGNYCISNSIGRILWGSPREPNAPLDCLCCIGPTGLKPLFRKFAFTVSHLILSNFNSSLLFAASSPEVFDQRLTSLSFSAFFRPSKTVQSTGQMQPRTVDWVWGPAPHVQEKTVFSPGSSLAPVASLG